MSEERFYPTFYEWPSYFSPPDVDDGPDETDDRYPDGCCQDCGAELAFMGYSGSAEDTYEVYACPKCDLPKPPWTPAPKATPIDIADKDDEVPF